MSLINREDLMQTLGITDMDCEKCGWYSRTARRCKRGSDFEDACCAIDDALEVEPEPHWIPCSERLPEQYGNYLISYRTDDFESDIGTFDPDRINSDTGEWSACDANGFYWVASKGLEVIAWMPLPESYKERREE